MIIFLGKFSSRMIIFLLLPLYTALLDPSEYGTADLITTYITLLIPVLTIELEMGVFRFLVDERGSDRNQGRILKNAVWLFNRFAAAFCIGYWIVSLFITIPYKIPVFFSILFGFYWGLLLQIARGYGDNKAYAIGSFITGLVTAVSNIVLIKGLHYGADGILISTAAGYLSCVIYLFLKLDLKNKYHGRLDNSLQNDLIRYSLPLVPNTVCWWIINAADRTIVSLLLGVAVNGIYAIAVKFPSAIASVFYTFTVSWTESAAVHINDSDRDKFFNEVFDTVLRLFFSLSIGVIAVMPFIFPFFIKEAYSEAYRYIPVAMIGALLNCIANMYNGIYVALKRTDIVAKTSVIAAAINLIVDLALMKTIGIYAAFLSTIAAYLWMFLYKNKNLKQYVNTQYDFKVIGVCSLVFGIVIYMYFGNRPMNCFGLVLAVVFALAVNRKFLGEAAGKVIRKIR